MNKYNATKVLGRMALEEAQDIAKRAWAYREDDIIDIGIKIKKQLLMEIVEGDVGEDAAESSPASRSIEVADAILALTRSLEIQRHMHGLPSDEIEELIRHLALYAKFGPEYVERGWK